MLNEPSYWTRREGHLAHQRSQAHMYFEGDYVNESYEKAGKYFGMAYDRKADIQPWTLIIAGSYWEKRAEEENDDESLLFAINKSASIWPIERGLELSALIQHLPFLDIVHDQIFNRCSALEIQYIIILFKVVISKQLSGKTFILF